MCIIKQKFIKICIAIVALISIIIFALNQIQNKLHFGVISIGNEVENKNSILLTDLQEASTQQFNLSKFLNFHKLVLLNVAYDGKRLLLLTQNSNYDINLLIIFEEGSLSEVFIAESDKIENNSHFYLADNGYVTIVVKNNVYAVSLESKNVIKKNIYNFRTDYLMYDKSGNFFVDTRNHINEFLNENLDITTAYFYDFKHNVGIVGNTHYIWLNNNNQSIHFSFQGTPFVESYNYPYLVVRNSVMYSGLEGYKSSLLYAIGFEEIPANHSCLIDLKNHSIYVLPPSVDNKGINYERAFIIPNQESYIRLVTLLRHLSY